MERINSTVIWYQQKIGAYDKQLWEKSVEKSVIKSWTENIAHVPRKPCIVKTDLIDVDLVRGSTFPKAKPKHGLWMIYCKGILRLVFLPVYIRWWRQQTSTAFGGLLLLLYTLQGATLVVYCTDTGASVNAETLSLAHLLIPLVLMLILALIHALMVATVSSHKHRRTQTPDRERVARTVKKARKAKRAPAYLPDTDANGLADTEEGRVQEEGKMKRKKKVARRKSPSLSLESEGSASALTKRNRYKSGENESLTKSTETSSDRCTEEDSKAQLNSSVLSSSSNKTLTNSNPRKPHTKTSASNGSYLLMEEKQDDFSFDSSLNSSYGATKTTGSGPDYHRKERIEDCGKGKLKDKSVSYKTPGDDEDDNHAYCCGGSGKHTLHDNHSAPGDKLCYKMSPDDCDDETMDVRCPSDEDLNFPIALGDGEILLPDKEGFSLGGEGNVNISVGCDTVKSRGVSSGKGGHISSNNLQGGHCNGDNQSYLFHDNGDIVINGGDFHEQTESETKLNGENESETRPFLESVGNSGGYVRTCVESSQSNSDECSSHSQDSAVDSVTDSTAVMVEDFLRGLSSLETIAEGSMEEKQLVYVQSQGALTNGGILEKEKENMNRVVGDITSVPVNNVPSKERLNLSLHRQLSPTGGLRQRLKGGAYARSPLAGKPRGAPTTGEDRDISSGQEETYHSGRHVQLLAVQNSHSRDAKDSNSSCESEGETTPNAANTPKGQTSEVEWDDAMNPADLSSDTETTPVTESDPDGSAGEGEDGSGTGGAAVAGQDDFGWNDTLHHANSVMNNLASSTDKVSCVIWETEEVKKVDLTVLDLGWTIIQKADKLPEKSDYLIIGLTFSVAMMMLPLLFRYHHLKDHMDSSTSANLTHLLIADKLIGNNWRERVVILNGVFQRFCISLVFFFLLSVAEKTFKQRLLYAKHFCYLTSCRRAKKYDMPHFRLNKVRNIKTWLSLRSYLKKRGPQRSVDTIVSSAFILAVVFVSLMCVELLHDTGGFLDHLGNWELTCWCFALGIYLLRFMTLGTDINKKYRNFSVLITEQINLYLHMEQKPHKKDELMLANNVLKLAEALLKELESPFRISGLSVNPFLYNITKVVILSAFSAVLTELLGFKLKLYKIKLKA